MGYCVAAGEFLYQIIVIFVVGVLIRVFRRVYSISKVLGGWMGSLVKEDIYQTDFFTLAQVHLVLSFSVHLSYLVLIE